MNRNAIRVALSAYLKAERQHKAVLHDQEIQSLYKADRIDEARQLTVERYPEARNRTAYALRLIKYMTDGIPGWQDISPIDVYTNYRAFEKLLRIAKRV